MKVHEMPQNYMYQFIPELRQQTACYKRLGGFPIEIETKIASLLHIT